MQEDPVHRGGNVQEHWFHLLLLLLAIAEMLVAMLPL